MKQAKPVLLLVRWVDAHVAYAGWDHASGVEQEPKVVTSVGFLQPKAKAGHIVLASNVIFSDVEPVVDSGIAVPYANIVEVRNLTEGNRTTKWK
jgi:hypothetical protein